MVKFNKGYNFIALIVSIIFLLTNTVYPCPLRDSLRVPAGQKPTFTRIIGAMHSGANRLEALKRFLRIKGIDIEQWASEQKEKMTEKDKTAISEALKDIDPNVTLAQIDSLVDKIILCEIPQEISLEKTKGKIDYKSRIGALIVSTKDGPKILFPRDRISNFRYLPDLQHDVVELNEILNGTEESKAHEIALKARDKFLKEGKYTIPQIKDSKVVYDYPLAAMHAKVDIVDVIKTHLLALQKNDDAAGFHRTLKLLTAAMDGDHAILQKSGPMENENIQATLGRLNELNTSNLSEENLANIITSAGRQADYNPIAKTLVALTIPVAPEAEVEDRELGERKGGAEERQKLDQLEQLKRGVEDNKFARVALFGDQHGQNAVLEGIVQAVEDGQVDEVIGHGDGFDRGSENVRNFEALKKLKALLGDKANLCFGNHDVWLIQALLLNDKLAYKQWFKQGGRELMEEFERKGQNPKELALWMLQNFKLFHIDERGFMHLHAGIPIDDEGNPLISREQLEKWQNELEAIQLDMVRNPNFMEEAQNIERVARLFEQAKDVVWVRMNDWVDKFAKQIDIDEVNKQKLDALLIQNGIKQHQIDQVWKKVVMQHGDQLKKAGIKFEVLEAPQIDMAKMDRLLAKLDVNGIIFGHEWQDRLMNLDNRIFCLDVHKGDNGFLIFNGDGIRFNALARTDEDLIASKSTVLAGINEEIIRLKQLVGEDVVEEQKAVADSRALIPREEVIAKEKISKVRKGMAKYSKDTMRRFKLALKVSWADGLFEFLVREATKKPGALRLHDIKVAGQEIAGVVYRENGQLVRGDRFLIDENEDIKIGRDITSGAYCFILGDRAFDLGQSAGQVVLIQRATPVIHFSLSRRVSNTPLELLVEMEEGATSSTKIDEVFMVSSQDELWQITKEMASLGEYGGSPVSDQTKELQVAPKEETISKTSYAQKVKRLGGNRTGGSLTANFVNEAWIKAGFFAYKIEIDQDGNVFFQRYNKKDGQPQGNRRQLILNSDFQVGRESAYGNDYSLPDKQLSGRHFKIRVSRTGVDTFKLNIEDLKSLNSTIIEWNEPIVDKIIGAMHEAITSSHKNRQGNI
ncbi:MAG: metallophosphoesterase [Candidatus Omnitrophica bacterium]|nr:metallophosphoesterase [Candidatus Omnitrophota bacterium]